MGYRVKRDLLAPAVRQRLVRLPAPHDSHYGVVPAAPPERGIDLGGTLDRLVAASSALARVQVLASETVDTFLVSRLLSRQEAVSSSAIEGTYSTLDELLAVEETQSDGPAPVRQVRDYAVALDRLVPIARERGPSIFDVSLLRRLHAEVVRSDPDYRDKPGAFRDAVVWIGGGGDIAYSTWNPPPPAMVEGCLLDTVDYMRNEGLQSQTHNLVVRMAVAHAHYEAVHPHRDGNGRVGRLLWPLMMAADGQVPLYLSPYVEANREAYYAALKAAQQRLDWAVMVGFVADAVVGTAAELDATRDALASLRGSWAGRRRFRKGAASTRALDLLPHHPVVTVGRLAEILDVTFAQANQAVAQLVEAGILEERTGHARNRVFAAREALRIVNRPFGEEPALPGDPAAVEGEPDDPFAP